MKKKMDRKAVSPLIATLILIVIVVSASSTIYIWSRSFIAEQLEKFGSPAELTCEEIDFVTQLEIAGGTSYELFVNNQANVDIPKLNLNFNREGKSIIKTFSANIKKGSTGNVSFDLRTVGISSFESIDVTPVLLAIGESSKTSKLFPCKTKTITGIKA